MALPSTYTQAYGQLGEFFSKIRDAQAPDKFTNQILKDLGFKSNNHRPFIPLMKSLGFLAADGTPTQRYHDYRNHSMSKNKMGEALKEAYSDIFLIKEKPTTSDRELIQGKFKSFHNASDNVALTLKDNDSDKNEDERNRRKSPRTNGTFAKPHKPTQNPSFAKEPFSANARPTQLSNIKTNNTWNFSINFSHINRYFNLTVIP